MPFLQNYGAAVKIKPKDKIHSLQQKRDDL